MRDQDSQNVNATRRHLLKAGAGAIAGTAIAAPYIRNAEAATTTTWKVQTSWPAGVGLNTFKTWANSIKEKQAASSNSSRSRPRRSSATSS